MNETNKIFFAEPDRWVSGDGTIVEGNWVHIIDDLQYVDQCISNKLSRATNAHTFSHAYITEAERWKPGFNTRLDSTIYCNTVSIRASTYSNDELQ